MYQYYCYVDRVIDADTMDVGIDLGFRIGIRETLRVYGIDAPEKNTPEGQAARDFVEEWLNDVQELVVQPIDGKRDKYGRTLANLEGDGVDLAKLLVSEGHAVAYDGGTKAAR